MIAAHVEVIDKPEGGCRTRDGHAPVLAVRRLADRTDPRYADWVRNPNVPALQNDNAIPRRHLASTLSRPRQSLPEVHRTSMSSSVLPKGGAVRSQSTI